MSGFINQWVAQGVQNTTTGSIMKWWRTNFNMPVSSNVVNVSTWNEGRGPWAYYNDGTSINLSGFVPGLEVTLQTSIAHWVSTTTGGNILLYHSLTRPDSTVIANYSFPYYVPGSMDWYEVGAWFNIGVAGWELDRNGTYVFNSYTTGYDALSSTSTNITVSNCPSVSTDGAAGYIWVEGNYLAIINAGGGANLPNGWKHRILGTSLGTSGDPGFIWVDTNSDLCFTRGDGTACRVPWKIKQFASSFSNGPTNSVYAGTTNAGKIWMDSEFGQTHIAYIGYDGWKYLCGAGDYPYSF